MISGSGLGIGLAVIGLAVARCAGVAGSGLATGIGFAAGVLLRMGIWTTAWQCGHCPFLPAVAAGVRTTLWQVGQENSIELAVASAVDSAGFGAFVVGGSLTASVGLGGGLCSSWGFGCGFVSGSGFSGWSFAGGLGAAAVGGGKATTGAGMMTNVPQFGHFPFLPAAASGVRTCWRQVGQGNSMGMMGGVVGAQVGYAGQFVFWAPILIGPPGIRICERGEFMGN